MPAQPCTYKASKDKRLQPITTICGKICDAGQSMCPRHILVTQAEADELRRKEEAARLKKEEKRKAELRAGARRR